MSINPSNNTPRVGSGPAQPVSNTPRLQPSHNAGFDQPDAASVHNSVGIDTSADIDGARVEAIRQAISEGSLQLSPQHIAQGIIDSAHELASE